jgi:protein-disulfide isomerase
MLLLPLRAARVDGIWNAVKDLQATADLRPSWAVVQAVPVVLKDAPLTLVEFTDYQCPFCRQFHVSTFEQRKKNYIDPGKLRYVSRDLPLPTRFSASTSRPANYLQTHRILPLSYGDESACSQRARTWRYSHPQGSRRA